MASKVVIVTGASRGIGLAIARELLKNNHKVCLVSRTDAESDNLKSSYPGQVEHMAADLTDAEAAANVTNLALKSFGRIDGLVVNHGTLTPIARLANCSLEEFKRCYDVNVFSAFNIVQVAIPELRKAKGCVVFTSTGASTGAYAAWGPYGSSKAALNSIGAHLATEEPDITSICIAPGRVDTEMQKELREKGEGVMNPAMHEDFVHAFHGGGLLKPEQPGNVMARLVANPDPRLTGKYMRWNDGALASYQGTP